MIQSFNKELVRRLKRDSDAQQLREELLKYREARRQELEDCTGAVQSHKFQGYCQALTDIIKTLSPESRQSLSGGLPDNNPP